MARQKEKIETDAGQVLQQPLKEEVTAGPGQGQMTDRELMEDPEQQEAPPTYTIICRNKISKQIGGVSFVEGIGYTSDGFKASWFGNKAGYEVRNTGSQGEQS